MALIFEHTASPLYYSNDSRLHVQRVVGDTGPVIWQVMDIGDSPVADGATIAAGTVLLETHERVIADAYIAGYDLATQK